MSRKYDVGRDYDLFSQGKVKCFKLNYCIYFDLNMYEKSIRFVEHRNVLFVNKMVLDW